MAEKRPLCLYNGAIQELATADSLPGGGGAATYEKTLSQPGEVSVFTGQSRWYPPVAITLVNVLSSVGVAPVGSSLIVDINKNGVSILTSTISAAAFKSTLGVPSDLALTTSDYLTVDVDQVGSSTPGSDLHVQIQYTRN